MTLSVTVTKKRAIIGGLLLALALTSAAIAAWLVFTTNGKGYGRIGSLAQPTINVQGTPVYGSACMPGGTCDLTVSVSNPNNIALTITALAAGNPADDTTSDPSNCPNGNLILNTTGVTFTPAVIPANASNLIVTIGGGPVSLLPGAPNACQGVTFTKGVKLQVST